MSPPVFLILLEVKMRVTKLLLASVALVGMLTVQSARASDGFAGLATLLDKSPLSYGYGLGYPAAVVGLDAMKENPAGAAFAKKPAVGLSGSLLGMGLNAGSLGYLHIVKGPGLGIGVSAFYLSKGSIDIYTADSPLEAVAIAPSDLIVSATVSKKVNKQIGIGVTGRYLSSTFDEETSATAFTADAGLRYFKSMGKVESGVKSVTIGVQGKNLTGTILEGALLMTINAGASIDYKIDSKMGSVLINPGISYSAAGIVFGAGVAYENVLENLSEGMGAIGSAKIKAGLAYQKDDNTIETAGTAGVSAGLGMEWEGIGVAYGLNLRGDVMGPQHFIGLSYTIK